MRTHANTHQEDSILDKGKQASPAVSWQLAQQLAAFVAPLLLELDALIDKRLVRTLLALLATLSVIVQFRNRPNGLLLSELGAYLLSPQQAPAGTKRLSNLLRCPKWQHTSIERFLWDRAKERCTFLQSCPPQAYQAGLLQPAWWSAHLCAGYAVAECAVDREE